MILDYNLILISQKFAPETSRTVVERLLLRVSPIATTFV